jgi:acyl carrier protein
VRTGLERIGIGALSEEKVLPALGRLLRGGLTQAVIADVDWNRFKPIYEARRPRPLLEFFATKAAVRPRSVFLDRFEATAAEERPQLLVTHLQQSIAALLKFDSPERVDPRQGFFEMGVDSLTAVELKNRLETDLARSLPPTIAFDYPNCATLGGYLAEALSPKQPVVAAAAAAAAIQPGGRVDSALKRVDDLSDDDAINAIMQLL